MRILVLGGTQFIGRHIVEVLMKAGHAVSILTRGKSPDPLPSHVERLRGDRDEGVSGLAALMGRSWDVCVDVSGYTARQVRPSAELLRNRIQRYVFISAVSVYGDPQDPPVRETHSRMPPAGEDIIEVQGEMYGRLKVTCENIVHQNYDHRATLLRPQIVVGPHDPSGRYTYWVQRAQESEAVADAEVARRDMLAPGDGSDHLQVIDVRDLAHFTKTVIEQDLGGNFNLAGPRLSWSHFMRLLGAGNLVWVPATVFQAEGVTEFELPLFRPEHGPRSGLMDVSNELARKAGLTLTEPEITLRDVRAWIAGRHLPPSLSAEREAALIRLARQGRS